MKISYCITIILLILILRGNGNSDTLLLLYPTYKVVEDAVMGNPEVRFLLKQTFFPSSNYRYWQVDGAEAIQWSRKQSRVAGATDTNCGCGFDY